MNGDLGAVVHIGARVAANASQAGVLVSSTVKDLVAGSEIHFQDGAIRSSTACPGAGDYSP
jgi:class 3 adenylate cyclase